MNRLSSHEMDERRRAAKRRQKAQRRARVVVQKTHEARVKSREAAAIEFRLRGLSQFSNYRAAREYAAVLQARKELL